MKDIALDRELLAKLLGMLGSDHDGEIANAGRAADALVRRAGVTWPEIVTSSPPTQSRERELDSITDAIDFCLEHAEVLTDWELNFCRSLRRQNRRLSEKQTSVLKGLVDKACMAERATC